MPRSRSVRIRNSTPRDAIVSASLGLLPVEVKRARESIGASGHSEVRVAEDWLVVPVDRSTGSHTDVLPSPRTTSGYAGGHKRLLEVVDLVAKHSGSDHASAGVSESAGELDVHPVVIAATRRRPKGPVFPEVNRPSKGSLAMAVRIAKDEQATERAFDQFEECVYAPQTLASKASLRNTWTLISSELGFQALPLTVEKIHAVTAVLKASGFRAAFSYVLEMKQFHIRSKFAWDDQLEMATKDVKRAAARGLGPPLKATEVKLEHFEVLWRHADGRALPSHWPALRHEVWMVAVAFLLREGELCSIRLTHDEVQVDMRCKTVSLCLPVSKSDQTGVGCKRTLCCKCRGPRHPGCPFCAVLTLVRNQCMRTNTTQLDPVAREIPLVATVGSAWDMVKKEHVIEALKADAEYLKANIPESTGYISVEKATGHTFRRSGAKALARQGVPLDLVQFMARHSSQAILGYVEEAIEECPAGHQRLMEHAELRDLVNHALKETNDVKRSVELVDRRLTEELINTDLGTRLDSELVYQMFDKWARPEVVTNVVTRKIHSTSGNNYRLNPNCWTTACGWRWVLSGKEAKACMDVNDFPGLLTPSNKSKSKLPAWALESL